MIFNIYIFLESYQNGRSIMCCIKLIGPTIGLSEHPHHLRATQGQWNLVSQEGLADQHATNSMPCQKVQSFNGTSWASTALFHMAFWLHTLNQHFAPSMLPCCHPFALCAGATSRLCPADSVLWLNLSPLRPECCQLGNMTPTSSFGISGCSASISEIWSCSTKNSSGTEPFCSF